MNIKLKERGFDAVDEIQAETQTTKHPNKETLPGCISKGAETLGSVYEGYGAE
jgi:hypothetical protein